MASIINYQSLSGHQAVNMEAWLRIETWLISTKGELWSAFRFKANLSSELYFENEEEIILMVPWQHAKQNIKLPIKTKAHSGIISGMFNGNFNLQISESDCICLRLFVKTCCEPENRYRSYCKWPALTFQVLTTQNAAFQTDRQQRGASSHWAPYSCLIL